MRLECGGGGRASSKAHEVWRPSVRVISDATDIAVTGQTSGKFGLHDKTLP